MSKSTIAISLAAFAIIASAWLLLLPSHRLSTETPEVFISSVDNWQEFYIRDQPAGTGWTHLAKPSTAEMFRSRIDPQILGWVKPEVCAECHGEIAQTCAQTAHARTSRAADFGELRQALGSGDFRMTTRDPRLSFEIEERNGRFWQVAEIQAGLASFSNGEPIDLVTGSGRHGLTFLSWKGDALYELPLSYFSESKRWVNSPGHYRDGTADFGRAIGDRCLDCHSTYFASRAGSFHQYDRSNFLLGVTCVRCHGRGWEHVEFHRRHPNHETAERLTKLSQLPPERLNDVCAQCHSGAGLLRRPAFSFQPGETLESYLDVPMADDAVVNDDPHAANQLARLRRSRCFKSSPTMTCISCHNVHERETGNTQVFSRRCRECHAADDCGKHASLGSDITDKCVECHMPSKLDAAGAMQTSTGSELPNLRDHLIQIWPDASRRVENQLKARAKNPSSPDQG